MAISYTALEKDSLKPLGIDSPTFDGSASLYASSSFLYALCFSAIIGAAFYRYVIAGTLRMQASEGSIRQSNEVFKKVTLGLLGVFSLFLIIFTVNKDLLTGDVGLSALRTIATAGGGNAGGGTPPGVVGGTGTTNTNSGSGGSSASCESTNTTISKLQSTGGICGGYTCGVLSGCNYQAYMSVIDSAVAGDAQLRKMIIVTMCKESRGNPKAQNRNDNGTYDCGVMQVNQTAPCESNPSQASIENNIRQGVSLMRQKISASSQVYPNIPAETGAFSSYNCCANGTVPNSPSADCNTSSGFPYPIPKWTCPINPGEGSFNMCSVKSYACELSVCMNQL